MAPNRSGYQQLAQSADDPEDSFEGNLSASLDGLPPPVTASSPTAGPSQRRRLRSNAPKSIDLSKLDVAFKRWTESIAQKVKRKKKVDDDGSRKEILRSVFEPQIHPSSLGYGPVKTLDHKPPMTQAEWNSIVQSVKNAIGEGIHPKMITKGSSGSYFARAKVEGRVQTVGVFKPKDEEPYGRLNPKTTKWLHRKLRWIIPFGRACLIPNLSYVSEAAASYLDQRLQLHIVPRTELVSLSSSAFFYDWIDRTAAKKGKQLPDKIGSMQFFMHGFTDASDFLRKYPWPGRAISDTFDDSNHRTRNVSKRFLNALRVICGRTGAEDDMYEDDDERVLYDATEGSAGRGFYWTEELMDSFREELEKLVILDYLMRNTDRGLDNFMIRYCDAEHDSSLVDVAPSRHTQSSMPQMSELRRDPPAPSQPASGPSTDPLRQPINQPPYARKPHMHIAAIDNSLSFPHQHPKGWRSYTYGWLFLPVSIIGRPFSQKTRDHFLPLLTDKKWWEQTTYELRKMFAIDPGFHPSMFARQMAVIKGQAYNIVQSLKHQDEGPLELTRRDKLLVWDDEVQLTDDNYHDIISSPTSPVRTRAPPPPRRIVPFMRRTRSQSIGADLPPPMRRVSSDGMARPVPFAQRAQRVHPGTTGVTVLEHMEQIDAAERGLQQLEPRIVDDVREETEEVDVGDAVQPRPVQIPPLAPPPAPGATSPRSDPLPVVQELIQVDAPEVVEPVQEEQEDDEREVDEEDLAALSKSTGHLEISPSRLHARWTSAGEGAHPIFELFGTPGDEHTKPKTVIVERLETVHAKPLLSFF